ncbi:type II secretion system protein [Candidatus Parcubacteria bacterium]|nr:MAG: type II secretion system protein [Candidatus Parcubacteria bacterium]
MKKSQNNQGMSLLGLVIVVLIIAILGTAVFLWVDPAARVGGAKDQKREQDVLSISNAIADYVNDHQGALPVLGSVTTAKKTLCTVQGGSNITCGADTLPCLRIADEEFYDKYLWQLPIDPNKSANTDTGYYLQKDVNGKLVVGACSTYGSTAVTKITSVKVNCSAYGGGHCWYLGSSTNEDCDNVCADNGLVCIEKASYGSDVSSGGSGFCALNRALGGESVCGSGCTLTTTDSPGNYDGSSSCIYREYPLDCSQKDSNYFNLCPCQ